MSEEALLSAYTTMRKKLLHIASRFLTDDDEADDALQEAFCRLWPHRNKIKTIEEATAITTTTLRNISIDKHRRQKIQTQPINEEHDQTEENNTIEHEELFKEVEEIIEQELTPLQQHILKRKEYQGDTLEQIAKELGMQPTAVRMQLSRARKKIKECYQKRNHQ